MWAKNSGRGKRTWGTSARRIFTLGILLYTFPLAGWAQSTSEATEESYADAVAAWRADRIDRLKGPQGWLSLAGLFWLKEGENSFGSDASNDLRFPAKAPKRMGQLTLAQGRVLLHAKDGVEILVDGKPTQAAELAPDQSGSPHKVQWSSLEWYILRRGDRFGVRLRDTLHPARPSLDTIAHFPTDIAWRIPATFQPADQSDSIRLTNVLGMDFTVLPAGTVHFDIDGESFQLTALEGGSDSYFMIFSDLSSGVETYGGGRYAYIPRADKMGKTIIDFNKAYNPPCAFTDYATCLLPPPENQLKVMIRAGEMTYGHH